MASLEQLNAAREAFFNKLAANHTIIDAVQAEFDQKLSSLADAPTLSAEFSNAVQTLKQTGEIIEIKNDTVRESFLKLVGECEKVAAPELQALKHTHMNYRATAASAAISGSLPETVVSPEVTTGAEAAVKPQPAVETVVTSTEGKPPMTDTPASKAAAGQAAKDAAKTEVAPVAKAAERNLGTPKWDATHKQIVFEGEHFPEVVALDEKGIKASEDYMAKFTSEAVQKELTAIQDKVKALPKPQQEAYENAFEEVIIKGAMPKKVDPAVSALLTESETLLRKHAGNEMDALRALMKESGLASIKAAREQNALIQKLTKLEGATDAELKAVKETFVKDLGEMEKSFKEMFGSDALKTLEKASGWLEKMGFGIVKNEGIGAALKNNFGKEAWKERKMGVAVKGAGTVVGLGLVVDAVGRGQAKGEDGAPVERSGLTRLVEAVIGLGAAAGFALHGGR